MTNVHAAPVVAGVDGSAGALEAVRWAAREARLRGTRLRLVAACGAPPLTDADAGHLDPAFGAVARHRAHEHLDVAVTRAHETERDLEVQTAVIADRPLPALVVESASAQLVAVGHRGSGGFDELLLGSVAFGLAARAACPVAVVRTAAPEDGPVVVGIDGSPCSEGALALAVEEAVARKVPLVAVHTWSDVAIDASVWTLVDWDAVEAEEHVVLAERLAGWAQKHPDLRIRRVVAHDRPVRALLEQAVGAQLMVVGSHGRGALRGLVLGSVSRSLLHHAGCPVVVARGAVAR